MDFSHLIKQKTYEKIVHPLRRHWITYAPFLAGYILLLLVPVAVYFILQSVFPASLTQQSWYAILVICAAIYYLLMYIYFFAHFVDFYLDVWIVTNDRIVDIEQFGLFSRSVSELDLFRIQDVTTHVNGVFATFFDYGNVEVKTASENADIIFRNVPHPNNVREELLMLAHEDRKFHYAQPTVADDD